MQRKPIKNCTFHVSSRVCMWLADDIQKTPPGHGYNIPHHSGLIDDVLYSKVSYVPPPHVHPTPQKTIILKLAVMQVLSTASSKALFKQCRKKGTWRASAHCVRGIHHCDREKLTKNISLKGSFFFNTSNVPCIMSSRCGRDAEMWTFGDSPLHYYDSGNADWTEQIWQKESHTMVEQTYIKIISMYFKSSAVCLYVVSKGNVLQNKAQCVTIC